MRTLCDADPALNLSPRRPECKKWDGRNCHGRAVLHLPWGGLHCPWRGVCVEAVMQNTGTVQCRLHDLAIVRLFGTASFVLALSAACCIAAAASKADGDDFVQDYLSARAWLSGEDAYRDLNAMRVA